MIGNDIVDISLAKKQSDWQRRGFLDKIFTCAEQEQIASAINPFQMVWTMWSMKESTYKVLIQKGYKRFNNPRKLECALDTFYKGCVSAFDEQFITSTQQHSDYIFTTAKLLAHSKTSTQSKVFSLDVDPSDLRSKAAYQELKQYLTLLKGWNLDSLKVKKTIRGVPQIFYNNTYLEIPLSLTHHGKFGAFSITVN